jgi:very-short-patch-repair endonuclease
VTELRRQVAELVRRAGWRTGSDIENDAALRLIRWGVGDCVQQMQVGRYRLDFAFPDVMIAIEIDGWQHGRPETMLRDAERDRALRAKGWTILRVDDGEEFFDRLLAAVLIVKSRRLWRG